MQIFHEDKYWEDFPVISNFRQVYNDKTGTLKYAILSDGDGNPNSTALMVIRMFIEEKTKTHKYVMGTRFFSFGDMAVLDVISLDLPNHRDIIAEHARRFGFVLPEKSGGDQSHTFPWAFVGGFVDGLKFTGSSGDFGDNFFGWSSNDVTNSTIGLINEKNKRPDDFFVNMLTFMKLHKIKRNFYEGLYAFLLDHAPAGKSLHPQHLGALLTMKVLDRVILDKVNYIQALVEEVSDGLGKSIMMENVIKSMKKP